MADVSCLWGSGLSVSSNGDFATAQGIGETQERVIRRLLSQPGDDIFNMAYGAGLPQLVGTTTNQQTLQGIVGQQLQAEEQVDSNQPVRASLQTIPGSGEYYVNVNYTDATTQQTIAVSGLQLGGA